MKKSKFVMLFACLSGLMMPQVVYSEGIYELVGYKPVNDFYLNGAMGNLVEDLIERWAKIAVPIARMHGLYPSIMLAQALIESGNGDSQLARPPYHNLFGMKVGKGWKGDKVNFPTSEWENDHYITIDAWFRRYPDYEASFQDNADLLAGLGEWDGWDYYSGARVQNAATFHEAAEWLQGRYATSPTYADTLINAIEKYGLDRFDGDMADSDMPVYRVRNPNDGRHMFTTNHNEVLACVKAGWEDEGIAFYAIKEGYGGTPLYRLYNDNSGEHFFTINRPEADDLVANGWKDEGIACYVIHPDSSEGCPIYRLYNTDPKSQDHLFTSNINERDQVSKYPGWRDEGIAFRVLRLQ